MMNIYKAISAIMEEGYAIGKNKRNAQQGFQYRGIDDVMNTFQPLLAKHHVFVVPEVLEQIREERVTDRGKTLIYSVMTMKYTFYADDGSAVSAVVIGEGMDSGDKASNKAMAVAMKYAMFQVFCIPTEEMRDPDAETPPESKPKPAPKPAIQTGTASVMRMPDKDEAPADPAVACASCGNPITATKKRDGSTWYAADMVSYSNRRFGKSLCGECMKAALKNES